VEEEGGQDAVSAFYRSGQARTERREKRRRKREDLRENRRAGRVHEGPKGQEV